jgi:phage shock protein A
MSSINFFSRLTNLLKGALSLIIADVEKNHPEIAYENAIRGLTGKYMQAKSATAALIRRRDDIKSRLDAAEKARAQVERDLSAAMATGQDDLALVLIEKKNALESELSELMAENEAAGRDADDAKDTLITVKGEIGKLKAEKDRELAKMKSAQAKKRIQEQLEGLSVDAEVQALDKVREHIKNTVAEANLGKELHESDLDVRLKKLSAGSGRITARAQLDEMKRKQAGAQAASVKQM